MVAAPRSSAAPLSASGPSAELGSLRGTKKPSDRLRTDSERRLQKKKVRGGGGQKSQAAGFVRALLSPKIWDSLFLSGERGARFPLLRPSFLPLAYHPPLLITRVRIEKKTKENKKRLHTACCRRRRRRFPLSLARSQFFLNFLFFFPELSARKN